MRQVLQGLWWRHPWDPRDAPPPYVMRSQQPQDARRNLHATVRFDTFKVAYNGVT